MKKTLSILFASLILLTGMHITVATHFCGGVFAGSKTSFSGELATCGMEESENKTPIQGIHYDTKCCDDNLLTYSVDNNYTTSNSIYLELAKTITTVDYLILDISYLSPSTKRLLSANVFPPGDLGTNAVSIVDICVFRI